MMRLTLPHIAYWLLILVHSTVSQSNTLGLSDGFLSFNTSTFAVQLVKDSQTLYSLSTIDGGFNFIPSDMMSERANNGNYHLGDITFRARTVGSTAWTSGDTSTSRVKLTASSVSGTTKAAANLAPTLPRNSLLNITRRWVVDDNVLQLLFDVTNSQTTAVEIGSLGAPLEFNNIFTDRTAAQTNTLCSLFDPYIGQDAGYIQVTPLLGTLPPLVVLPVGQSPLEGWRFLPESTALTPFYQSQTFEGLYEWDFHTLAYAENEWASTTPWNAPTSFVLQPGQTRTYGLQFRVAPSIREIESTVASVGQPVAVTIPGTILPADQVGKVFLNTNATVANITVSPAGALTWETNTDAQTSGWLGYTVTPHTWGRSRLSVTYSDGRLQTIHYYVTKGATAALDDLGNFLTTSQWYTNTSDPFHRAPSVISYDRSVNQVVTNDPRVWIGGLGDEAGSGSWLAAAMKQFVQPDAAEVAKLEQFVNQTLWGTIQNRNNATVKMSVFFYQPDLVPNYVYPSNEDWTVWWSWNQASAWATGRGYDYVHVTAAYWAMYRVARNYPDLVTVHDWQWYINQAVLTVTTLTDGQVGYVDDGLMGETVIRFLLSDLQREGLTANATLVQSRMQSRWKIWSTERYPFGSEMAWDSTGQEGVYIWSTFFNDSTTALNALNSILAYQPVVAHWGYNGNARRYWDNIYGGKLMRIERQIHHYGSGLNALPLIENFEANPTDYYLLRAGFGGLSGPLSNIDEGGFASASFHSFADTMAWDAYSGDYGPNFSGHSMGMGTFIIDHPDFGWQAFGGTVVATSPAVQVQIKDSVRRRVFIAPLGALLSLDAGAFSTVSYNPSAKTVTVTIAPVADGTSGAASAPIGRLVISQTASVAGVGLLKPTTSLATDAGAFVIPFTNGVGTVTLS
ncbi:hypothetical protein EV361DRAFT_936418 [Lentinula raphanica]|uniref:Glycoside hydrolase family 43 protein n=1 Tax=Lentinula raphanica TaxID=153919 RepID=A0AA38UGD9_9AGAR|nr:hypothetical protein F5878DRAFT_612085 [Lentinula raphanica]KAJ3966167.1 hypothetical protein EV361DRAFT_936418 [Lentinula raphanica]